MPLSANQRAILRSWYNKGKGFSVIKAKNLEYVGPSERFSKHTRLAMLEAPIRILLIERSVPKPNQDAGSMMIYSFIRVFREQGHAVSFFPADMAYDPDYTPPLLALGVKCLHAPEVESLSAHLVEAGDSYDIVIVCRPDYADAFLPLLRTLCPHARLLYETHDLHFVREQRQAEFEQRPDLLELARLRKDQELRIAASV